MPVTAPSAVETLDTWFAKLREVHARTNCVAWWDEERAYTTARRLDEQRARGARAGPLHGVPFTAKEWLDTEGLPGTGGFEATRDRTAKHDASVVVRMREAGAILMAKTAVQVETAQFGKVCNPHDPARSPGASSSGEAAAVGGGGSPVGLASDSGGSIRVPAAWCGAVGLKPTHGRVPSTGHFPRVGERGDGRTVIGPIAATVDDAAAVLRVIAGPDGVDTGCPPVAPATGGSDLASRRVAWLTGEEQWSVDDATRAAVQQAVRILDARGARPMGETSMRLVESFDITTRYWRRSELSGAESQLQLDDWDRYRRAMERRDEFDIVVMPATACVAPPWRAMDEEDFVFTLPASLLGWPAITVPVRTSEHDLPAAVQIVARGWHDDLVLAAGRAIEQDSVRTN